MGSFARNWIGDPKIAIFSIAAVQVWAHAGQMMIVFIAGLQGIPAELYEAARMDGGSKWQVFRTVTWPLLAPSATIVVAYTTIQSFKAFDLIFTMTDGGPNYATEILTTYIYHTAFGSYSLVWLLRFDDLPGAARAVDIVAVQGFACRPGKLLTDKCWLLFVSVIGEIWQVKMYTRVCERGIVENRELCSKNTS